MSSKNLCQDPLLVWPGVLQQQSKRFLEVANTTAHLEVPSFDDERKGDIKRLIDAMKRDYPDMQRAIAWYQSLLDRESSQTREPYTTLTFLRNVPDEGPNIHDFQLGAPPPAQQPHNLQVVFHRRPLWAKGLAENFCLGLLCSSCFLLVIVGRNNAHINTICNLGAASLHWIAFCLIKDL